MYGGDMQLLNCPKLTWAAKIIYKSTLEMETQYKLPLSGKTQL